MFNELQVHKYRHISFDLWLTLIRSNPEFKPRRNALFRDFFAIDKPLDEVSAVIRKFDVLTNSVNEKVGRNFHTHEIYYLILDGLGVDIETINTTQLNGFYDAAEALMMQYKPLLLHDSIPTFFEGLKQQGITTNILSNTAFIKGRSLRRVLAGYGLEDSFAFQAYSDETGYSKPAVEMYAHAYNNILTLGDIKKEEVLHVGDNAVSDYNGALQFGFNAFLLTNHIPNEPKLQPA